MIDRQTLAVKLLIDKLSDTKVGILVKGITDIFPDKIAAELAEKRNTHMYIAAVGYGLDSEISEETFTITPSVEKAVLWRSIPEYAGNIIVFVRSDTDKLHSLAEFETISLRDMSKYLIQLQINGESNAPTVNFWRALQKNSDYYPFDSVLDFVNAVDSSDKKSEAIPNNMWQLNLLRDTDILGTKIKAEERLEKNRELIFAIGQLSEDSRKKLSRSLARTKNEDKKRLQKALTKSV